MKRFTRDLEKFEGLLQTLIAPTLSVSMKALMGVKDTSVVEDTDLVSGTFGPTEVDGSDSLSTVLDAVTPVSQSDIGELFTAIEDKVSGKGIPRNPDLVHAMPLIFPFNGQMYTLNLTAIQWLWGVTMSDDLTDAELVSVIREYWSSPWKTTALPTVFLPLNNGKDSSEGIKRSSFDASAIPTMLIQPPVSCDWPSFGVEGGGRPLSGASVIMGGPGAGKTTFTFTRLNADVIIRIGERPEQVDVDPRVIFARSIVDAIGLAWWLALIGAHVVIDSLRSLAYGMKGAAAEKGIKTGLFNAITDMTCLFNLTRNHVVMTLNPLLPDDAMETLFSHLTGSASGVLWLHNKGQQKKVEVFTADGRLHLSDAPSSSKTTGSVDDLWLERTGANTDLVAVADFVDESESYPVIDDTFEPSDIREGTRFDLDI